MARAVRSLTLAALALAALLWAQEGHPLTGTWSGDWGPPGGPRTHVTIVMNWDGKAVTGVINPGPEAIKLAAATIDFSNWSVRLEAEDKQGGRIVGEGRIEDLASPHRSIRGTFVQGTMQGDFKITRD
jgi:hypothetical protein